MSDLKLFRIADGRAQELGGRAVALERQLQRIIESNMETFFGVRFLSSEYSTGPKHRGRIEHVVRQNNHNIELVRYRDFEGELLALELLTAVSTSMPTTQVPQPTPAMTAPVAEPTVLDYLSNAPETLKNLYSDLDAQLLALGDDIQKTTRKNYFAYKRLKNFACVEVHPQSRTLLVYLKVDPDSIKLEPGFSRDVRGIGHFGTGSLELRLKSADDLAKTESLLQTSYEVS